MKKSEFIAMIEQITEADEGSLSGSESLRDLDGWDSLAVIQFIARVDENFGITLTPKRLVECKTVDDLAGLLGDRITA